MISFGFEPKCCPSHLDDSVFVNLYEDSGPDVGLPDAELGAQVPHQHHALHHGIVLREGLSSLNGLCHSENFERRIEPSFDIMNSSSFFLKAIKKTLLSVSDLNL